MLALVGLVVTTGLLVSSGNEAAEELHKIASYTRRGRVWHKL
jgi:hypothetical protein